MRSYQYFLKDPPLKTELKTTNDDDVEESSAATSYSTRDAFEKANPESEPVRSSSSTAASSTSSKPNPVSSRSAVRTTVAENIEPSNYYKPGVQVVDLANIDTRKSRWWNPFSWGRDNDVRDLVKRGFIYQDTNGNLISSNGLTEDLLREKARQAADAERLARKYGKDTVNTVGWSDNAKRVRQAMINSDSGYVTLTLYKPLTAASGSTSNPNKRRYQWSLSSNPYSQGYNQLFRTVYQNGGYDVLNGLGGNSASISDDTINKYIQDQYGGNRNQFLNDLVQNKYVTEQLLRDYGLSHPNLGDYTTQLDAEAFNNNAEAWKAYGIKSPQEAYAVQLFLNILNPSMTLDEQLRSALNGRNFANYFTDNGYYIHSKNGRNYYFGDSKVYDNTGAEAHPTYSNNTWTFKNGGRMNYYQSGGNVLQDQRAVLKEALMAAASGDMQSLSQILGISTEDQLKQFIDLTVKISKQKDADPEMAELATKALQGMQEAMAVKAARGAKLNYIKMLNGRCPEGYEMKMYKVGGKVCKKCQKIEEACGGKKLEEGGESPIVTKFKKGRKCTK